MSVSLANATPDQLRTADVIEAVDAKRPSYRQQVWGQGVVPAMRPYPAGPHLMQTLEVQVDSNSDAEFQDLLRRVEAAKGVLHPDVAALKK